MHTTSTRISGNMIQLFLFSNCNYILHGMRNGVGLGANFASTKLVHF